MESTERERIERGLQFLKNEFGKIPTVFCNHGQHIDNIYWGEKRFRNPLLVLMHKLMKRNSNFKGDVKDNKYFWGNFHKKYFLYTRNLTFTSEINLMKVDPFMPFKGGKKIF